MFLKISSYLQETPVLELPFNIVPRLEVYNCIKKRLQHRCFLVNIAKFLRTPILKNLGERLRLYFNHKINNKILGICRPFCIQEHNVKSFLLIRFVDLSRIYFLLIISRKHSNTVKYCSKGYLFWYHNFDRYAQVVAKF